jgi:hypothetical protein
MIGQQFLQYPPPPDQLEEHFGVYPVDFTLEAVLRAGVDWFLNTPEAPNLVYGHLLSTWLNQKYGQAKIDEIAAFIKKYEIPIVQHWSLIPERVPCISIQLLDANEEESRAGLDDHKEMVDIINEQNDNIIGRTQVGYSPIIDQIHIGIHANQTPDLAKYLYYLVIYLLNGFKPQLQEKGLMLSTFRATDLSRMNEYLPDNIYSRFINFSCFTVAPYKKTELPIIDEILGIRVPDPDSGETSVEDDELSQDGVRVLDSQDNE